MSVPCVGIVSNPAAEVPGDYKGLPIDPATGGVRVAGGGGPAGANRPMSLIAPGAAVASATITFTTVNGIVYGFYFQVPTTTAAGLYAQIILGIVAPVTTVTVPFKRSPIPVTPGEEYVFAPPEGIAHADGFIMILSSTQDVFTTPAGVVTFQPRAVGIL